METEPSDHWGREAGRLRLHGGFPSHRAAESNLVETAQERTTKQGRRGRLRIGRVAGGSHRPHLHRGRHPHVPLDVLYDIICYMI